MTFMDIIGNEYFRRVFFYLISAIGMYGIFIKCGKKAWHAFIPLLRYYFLAAAVKKEKEGRVYLLLYVFQAILNIMTDLIEQGNPDPINDRNYLLFIALSLGVSICLMLYVIRIDAALCEKFGMRKRWIWLLEFAEGITYIYWGWSKKIVPVLTDDEDVEGAMVSGAHAGTLKDGLTVNIEKRTAKVQYKERVLLKDIHLAIPKGHMVLLLGGSGAGKTTFLNAVTGYEKADANILLAGRDLYKEYESMKYDVGFVPQQDLVRLNDNVKLTLSDAATLRLPGNITRKEREKRVNEVLEEFGLAPLAGTLVEKLSGGQRKRLSIAMEYISNPSLFILDEPDSGLDGVVARGLFEKLRDIADQGKIVIVITHTPDRVIDLFDDVIVLAKDVDRTGRLAYYGSVEDSYKFFDKTGMEQILRSINQKDEGGEGRATEFVERYAGKLMPAEG
jgi:ABC-type multidrug transport system ATPase subunit